MRAFRTIVVFLLWTAAGVAATAQERRLEVVGIQSNDLERTAYHLGVTLEQVDEIRELIKKATDLALESELDSAWTLDRLAWLWRRADPRHALAKITGLLDKLKSTARDTSDPAVYRWCVSEARQLITNMFRHGDGRFEEFFDDWPERPDLGDEAAQSTLTGITEQVRSQRILRTAKGDPLAAAELLRSDTMVLTGSATLEVAYRLDRAGQTEAAGRLVQEALAQFRELPDSQIVTLSFLRFLSGVAIWFPDQFVPALRLFVSRERTLPEGSFGSGFRLESGRGSVQLDPMEARLFETLLSLRSSPETVPAALEALPRLKAKLDQVGGFNQALRADMVRKDGSGGESRHNPYDKGVINSLAYRWGEADERPSEVRRRLRGLLNEGREWEVLGLVRTECDHDPAFSRIGLEVLDEFTRDRDSAARLRWLPYLLAIHRQCEGRTDRALIEEGFRLLDEAKAHKEQSSGDAPPPDSNLEYQLLVEWSRLDFDAASEHVRQLEQPAERFKLYVAMAEGRLGH